MTKTFVLEILKGIGFKLIKIVPYLFLYFISHIAFSQVDSFHFYHLHTDKNLSESFISQITQDKYGFMWVATEEGLYKFDGYSSTSYVSKATEQGSLSHNLVITVFNDSQKNLWVGSLGGLDKYNFRSDKFTHYRPKPNALMGEISNFIHRLVEDQHGNIWVGTNDGLLKFSPSAGKFKKVISFNGSPKISNPVIRSLFFDKIESVLWVGTENGLYKINLKTQQIHEFYHNPLDNNSLSDNIIRSIYKDKEGHLWIGTQKGLNKLDLETKTFFLYSHNKSDKSSINSDTILAIYEDKLTNLWCGTWNGLSILNKKTNKFTSYVSDPSKTDGLKGNIITTFYEDNVGNLWLGTNQGLHKIITKNKSFHNYAINHASDNNVVHASSALVEEKDDIYWVGKQNNLIRFDRKNRQNTNVPFFYNKWIYALHYAKNDLLWVGSRDGLYSLNTKTNSITDYRHLVDSEIWHLHEDKDGILWVGTIDGLYEIDFEKNRKRVYKNDEFNSNSISDNHVGHIFEEKNGILWISTQNGLNRLDKRTGIFKSYKPTTGDSANFSSNIILQTFIDSRGLIWVGTMGGLYQFTLKTGKFRFYPDEYFELNEIDGIIGDKKGNLWIKTPTGIYKFNPARNTRKYYSSSDGLQPKFKVGDNLINSKGEIFFTGHIGITVFHPDSIKETTHLPSVYITDFKIFDKQVTYDSTIFKTSLLESPEIKLNYKQSTFSFDFAALNYSNPEKTRYAYKLEGLEDNWNYVGNRRFASYNNVPLGKEYIFKVKAANNKGVWNPKEASIKIKMEAPFWETIWFKTLAAVFIFAIALIGYKLRIREYKRQKQELEEKVRERTAQISAQKAQLEIQAREIERMLKKDNQRLSEKVQTLAKARVMQKQVSFEEFQKIYPDQDACYQFLAELKWSQGYKCTRCKNTNYSPGPVPFSRRCSRCSIVERVTTGTIFSRVTFPITKAFYMLFFLSSGKKLTIDELSEMLDHPRQTCWTFRKKIMEVVQSKGNLKKGGSKWSDFILIE